MGGAVFKHIILRAIREILVSQRKEQSLSDGGMQEAFIKDSEELVEIRQSRSSQVRGTMSQCLGVRKSMGNSGNGEYWGQAWKMRLSDRCDQITASLECQTKESGVSLSTAVMQPHST